MKNKTRIVLEVFLLFFLAAVLLVWGILLPPVYEETFLGELKYKYERLRTVEGPRLIIAGGSGAAFGVDSVLLKQEFPEYEVVNLGMYAGLGSGYILDLLRGNLGEGDLVIFMPEQEKQMLTDYFNSEYFWQAADGAPELIWQAGRKFWGQILGQYPVFAAEKARRYLKKDFLRGSGIYAKSSFNEFGDISVSCECNIMPEGYDSNMPILFEQEMASDDFAEMVNEIAREAQKNGATLYYHFCPMNEWAVKRAEGIDQYCDTLMQKLQIRLLGDPKDSVMAAEWFYDTNFHLNSSGKRVFTALLIQNLKAERLDSSPTKITLPEKPEMMITFNTSEKGEILRITKETLSGQENTEELIIQEPIQYIEDGAFSEMPKLKKIYLTNTNPQECLVGQGLLDGTDADVYVPKEKLNDFKLGYYWSMYASRLKGF